MTVLIGAGLYAVLGGEGICLTAYAAEPDPAKHVLALLPYEDSRPGAAAILKGIHLGLRESYPGEVQVFSEFLSTPIPAPDGFSRSLVDWITYKYSSHRFDVICAFDSKGLELAEVLRAQQMPRPPLIFVGLRSSSGAAPRPKPGATGIYLAIDTMDSIRSALAMLPGTRHIALVGGASPEDLAAHQALAASMRSMAPEVEILPIAGQTVAETVSAVRNLPEQTFIYLGRYYFDANGVAVTVPDLIDALAPVANRPIFEITDLAFGSGVVGGSMVSLLGGGEALGRQIGSVLAGHRPEDIPMVEFAAVSRVDWRQLKKWGIPESRVPAGTEVMFRPVPLWVQYRNLAAAIGAALVLQALLIGLLLIERRRRRKSESAVRQSEALNRAVISSLQSGIAVLDRRGVFISGLQAVSSASREVAGLLDRASEIYLDSWRRRWSAGDVESSRVVETIESVLKGRERSMAVVYHDGQGVDGRWYEIRVESLTWHAGGAVVSHLDITPQMQAEITHRQLQDELSHMNRVASVGHLAGSFSHELTQPLASILSNAQAALRFLILPQPDFVEVREAIADIVSEDQRACTIIEMLRTILRKRTVLIRQVDLNQTAIAVTRIVKSDAQMRGVNLRLELAPEPVIALGDDIPLQQVLLNLCNNGMDAMQVMSPETRTLTIRTTLCSAGRSGCLFVEDTGTGVPEEIQAKLFTPFFTTKSKGLGIGLSICQSIVEGLKGEIRTANQPEGGATFCVALPLAELAALSASHSSGAGSGGSLTQTGTLGGPAV